MREERDCNTCADHVQGATGAVIPKTCRSCMTINENTGRFLPLWRPITMQEILRPLVDPEWPAPIPPEARAVPAEAVKPTNPKDLIGSNKLPLHLWPTTATAAGCMAFLEGALKYGRSNWRVVGVRATVYYDALQRHMAAWLEGEDVDPESGLPHLAKALACIAILVDAEAAGKLNDDRPYPGGAYDQAARLTPEVEKLKARHADKNPTHYTIADWREEL